MTYELLSQRKKLNKRGRRGGPNRARGLENIKKKNKREDAYYGPERVPKLDKRKKKTSKKFDDDFMSTNYDVTVISPIYGQFVEIRNSDSGCIVCKTYIFISSNLLSYKNWKQN